MLQLHLLLVVNTMMYLVLKKEQLSMFLQEKVLCMNFLNGEHILII